MVTIDKIDFSKLKHYDGRVTKCFEQLCYQIAQKEFGHLGSFTPIDGSGGDGGVEFYLNHQNGEKWGWQCKFFSDTGRLNVSSRASAIEESLETACRNHKDLTKWFLCLKTDLTTDSLSKKGKFSKGERSWFENDLPKHVPDEMSVEIEHWGESTFLNFLKEPKHIGIRSFFFGELEFTFEWFKNRFDDNFEKVKDKYDPQLHSIDKYTQSKIDFTLFSPNYCILLNQLQEQLNKKSDEIQLAIKNYKEEKLFNAKEEAQRETFILYCEEFNNLIAFAHDEIEFIKNCFRDYSEELFLRFDNKDFIKNFNNYYSGIKFSSEDHSLSESENEYNIANLISEFANIYTAFFTNYFHENNKDLHIIGDAAKGKTHVSCDIAYRNINSCKPAIFITGDKFTDENSITDTIKKILDISQEYTFEDFVQSLDTYASIVKTRIPIIIDGLNETTHNRFFSPIWNNHLDSFINKITSTNNIVVITTCRGSYVDRIWANKKEYNFCPLYGFRDYQTILEAVSKYFKKYNLKADLFFASLEKFKDPIFLKIFCEIKNPGFKNDEEAEVNLEEESQFEIFNQYLKQVNTRITLQNPIFRKNEKFVKNSLEKLAKYLWDNKIREIEIDDFYKIIDGDVPYQKDLSKADVLIFEGLVINRDTRNDQEFISFTYQILSGYIISELLIKENALEYFISKDFINKVFSNDNRHPLFDDIINSLILLFPQINGIHFYELLKSEIYNTFRDESYEEGLKFFSYAQNRSIAAVFKLPSQFVKESDKVFVSKLFANSLKNKERTFNLSFKTLSDIKHPLNALYISKLLLSMEMNERDISWTEYIRKNANELEEYILQFQNQCANLLEDSKILVQKLHIISSYVIWFLTSTNRALRDIATQALYYYGRRFPNEFSQLVYESLQINDPYVWERALACLYGITMAEHNSLKSDKFKNDILPEISKNLFELMFKESALHSTTHILARDYARRTIEIGLLHYPDLLTQSEIRKIRPPYRNGGIRDLGEHNYGEKEYDFSGPIRMDFSNYTLGHIVMEGSSYSNPPEKQKVRRQIYWRIFNLGWNEELFKDAEKALGNDIYYNRGRTERAKTERYGKKYSWIAFFENAGLRSDLGLLKREDDRFRISDSDIDPSFPIKSNNEMFFTHDLLGDRSAPLVEWYENGKMPFIEEYLSLNKIKDYEGEWVCLDGYINQEDIVAERRRFTYIRGFLIKEKDYEKGFKLLNKQNLGGRWLPEKKENYYTYAGELFNFPESTLDNREVLELKKKKKKKKIKKDDPEYFQALIYNMEDYMTDGKLNPEGEFPNEIEVEVIETEEIEVLLPVMEYNWESYHSHLNNAGNTTVVAKEIVNYLELVDQSQTFDLFDLNGDKASINIYYHNDYNNNHNFIYLRKDLLNKFLTENKMKFVWAIWGERVLSFMNDNRRFEFYTAHPYKEPQVFQKLIEYKM